MTDELPPIALILDHTALVAHDALVLGVGETIGEAWKNGEAVGVPTLCLAAALADDAEGGLFPALLADTDRVEQLDFDFWQVGRVARSFDKSLPHAAAALAVVENKDARVLTRTPELYLKVGIDAVLLEG